MASNLSSKSSFQEQERFIVILDILGFKNLYKDQKSIAFDLIAFLRSNHTDFYSNITQNSDNSKSILCIPDLYTYYDNIIISFPLNNDLGLMQVALLKTFEYLSKIYVHALSLGILLRGCITAGKIAFDPKSHIIFGEPLFDATEQEKLNILYPRIVILSPSYCMLKYIYDAPNFVPKWQDFIEINYIDIDGFVCIDWIKRYLLLQRNFYNIKEEKFFGISESFIMSMITIRIQIINNLEKFNNLKFIKEHQKWCYMANYFNKSLEPHFSHFIERGYLIEQIPINPCCHIPNHPNKTTLIEDELIQI